MRSFGRQRAALAPVLLPVSKLYALVSRAHHALYSSGCLRSYRSDLPVICVGNVIAGGSGKTPFVQYLCRLLSERLEISPSVLTRGYGGSDSGPRRVASEDTASVVGDEALLHRETSGAAAVIVARKRADGARLIEREQLGEVIVMDDGFQHYALQRDLNILLLDISSSESIALWKSGRLLPLGLGREHLRDGVRRADAVVLVDKSGEALSEKQRQLGRLARDHLLQSGVEEDLIFQFDLQASHLQNIENGERLELSILDGLNCVALTAIASPDSFLRIVRSYGGIIAEPAQLYPDHHHFEDADLERALQRELPLIVTEKDAAKLAAKLKRRTGAGQDCYALCLRGTLREREKEFASLIAAKIQTSSVKPEPYRANTAND